MLKKSIEILVIHFQRKAFHITNYCVYQKRLKGNAISDDDKLFLIKKKSINSIVKNQVGVEHHKFLFL
jgi:hypothetical protein